jgi:uracil-DNA glycosylase
MKRSQQIADHLAYFTELGTEGVSRDRAWRVREVERERRLTAPVADARPESNEEAEAATTGDAIGISMFDHVTVPSGGTGAERLAAIQTDLGDCTRCKLHTKRTNLVFGVGNPDAELMFVGEAPGRDEDMQGIPFVGRAGQLLTKIIESIDLRRDDVYIANVIKCRPPDNRNPAPDEVRTCEPFLFAQIDAIRPRVIVALGSFAARTLLRSEEPISRVRGRSFDYRGATLIPTFHPAFLLRSPDRKRDVWEDMKKVRSILQSG